MIYLSLDKNYIKLLALTKAILGQYSASYFNKYHESPLLENGNLTNTDLVASAIKEAVTLSSQKDLKDKDITLILPQEVFEFRRIDVPFDISDSAILPFIKDKVRAEIAFDLDAAAYDYTVSKLGTESKVLFYAISPEKIASIQEVFRLLGLSLKAILPDTFSYYKLFEKTLKKDKKENILYVNCEENNSFGYLYDSLGLVLPDHYSFGDPFDESVKNQVQALESPTFKLNRIILSGPKSDTIRQDFFTKDVGVWTNPLKKIISNFYTEYLKLIVLPPDNNFSYLEYAVAIGSFIFTQENPNFNILKKNSGLMKRSNSNREPRSFKFFNLRDILIFISAFAISFALIYFFPKISNFTKSNVKLGFTPSPTPTPAPKAPTATPTPAVTRETLKVKVLNGGGVAGMATKVKDILKEAGYTDIVTDNADNFDYKTSVIQVKDSMKGAASLMKEDLKDYTTTIKVGTLKDDDNADIIFIIGQEFK